MKLTLALSLFIWAQSLIVWWAITKIRPTKPLDYAKPEPPEQDPPDEDDDPEPEPAEPGPDYGTQADWTLAR
ncbi:hypothetical protein [Kineosporia sp. NBRC 101731]|uniref:hypothetical protein n=1 Tax=Kineosporia sp. NBRC 101731 TaxID=3032199 RepID=UPI0024A102EA|nr:hypothetical protein [Kineosporia sp. NBRC 101731]GLY32078.1 hypothetical protein Kisp02_54430 [Kineosporia sp. NBRC 101731]